jgi:hypothetical protein
MLRLCIADNGLEILPILRDESQARHRVPLRVVDRDVATFSIEDRQRHPLAVRRQAQSAVNTGGREAEKSW